MNIGSQMRDGQDRQAARLNEACRSLFFRNKSTRLVSKSASTGPRGGTTTPTVYDDGRRAQAGQTRASARRRRLVRLRKPAPSLYDLARMGLAFTSWGRGFRLYGVHRG